MNKKTKKGAAILAATAIVLSHTGSALAEDNTHPEMNGAEQINETGPGFSDQLPQAPPQEDEGHGPGGTRPSGEPPEKPGEGQNGPGHMESGHGPGPDKDAGSSAEGQLGSWSMGGTDASSEEGDDYAYDSSLYVTKEGIDSEKSAVDRI